MKDRYLVVAIGCIECGAPSWPDAVFDKLEDAQYHTEYMKHMSEFEGHTDLYIWDLATLEVIK